MSKTFEEKLENKNLQIVIRHHIPDDIDAIEDFILDQKQSAFRDGAQWAYLEGIKAAIEMLRSDAAQLKAKDCYRNGHCPDGNEFADWLEQQFKEELKK